jgi:hypothetical protein
LECEYHSGPHLYEDQVAVEVVDERNSPVPPGGLGAKLLVSVLFTRTPPLIFHEIGDMIRMARPLSRRLRGYPLIEEIQGRIEDVLRFPARDGGEVVSGMTAGPGTFMRGIEEALRSRGAVVPAIRIGNVPAIPRGPSGKAPLIECNLPHADRMRQFA